MLECIFANPDTYVTCDGEESIIPCDVQWDIISNSGLVTDRPLHVSSNTKNNPIFIPHGTFTSYISIDDVYQQTLAFGLSLVNCIYGNLE